MKIAVLSDIHGNHIALEAVLNKAISLKVERLFILGDIVGYYYNPEKVFELLNDWQYDLIQGNHEEIMLNSIVDSDYRKKMTLKYGTGINKAIEKLSDQQIELIRNLPKNKDIEVDGISFKLCHGSPWDRDEYIYPNSKKKILDRCNSYAYDFVLLGHTHYPFIYNSNNTSLVNVGSVGQARNIGGQANWVIINTENKSVVFQSTIYDTSSLKDEVIKEDSSNEYLINILNRK